MCSSDLLDAHPERFLDPQTARIPGLPSGRDGSPLTDHAISTPRFEAAIDAEDAVNLALTDDAHGLPMDAEILEMFGIPISGWSAPPDEIRLTGLITACADLPVTRDSPRRTRLAGGSRICFPKPHGLGTRVIVQVDVRILRLLQLLGGVTFDDLIRNGGTVAVADTRTPLPANRVSGDRLEDPGLVR